MVAIVTTKYRCGGDWIPEHMCRFADVRDIFGIPEERIFSRSESSGYVGDFFVIFGVVMYQISRMSGSLLFRMITCVVYH